MILHKKDVGVAGVAQWAWILYGAKYEIQDYVHARQTLYEVTFPSPGVLSSLA